MPNLEMSVPHVLKQDEAVKRVKKLITEFRNQFAGNINKVKEDWKGNTDDFSFEADGYQVSGRIVVKESSIDVTGEVPYPASLFISVIEATIKDKANKLLSQE
jgi:hypothetical protein